MLEPMNLAVPLFRIFGIRVRVHVMYIVVVLSLFLKAYSDNPSLWFDVLMVSVVMLFGIILVHEFGHCFAARYVDGEADEILMWPLGGLASCRPPHTAMANFITTAGGPAMNLAMCAAAGLALLAGGFAPPLNPLRSASAYNPVLSNIQNGKYYCGPWGAPFVQVGTTTEVRGREFHYLPSGIEVRVGNTDEFVRVERLACSPLPTWALWTARFFWLNLLVFCVNVFLPAFPLDGGRFLQEIVWSRSDYERGTVVACYFGLFVGAGMLVIPRWFEANYDLLGVFILFCSYMELKKMYEPEGDGFYDSSKGYMGFDDGDAPVPRPVPKPSYIKRWLQARAARRIQREIEEQQADDARMDDLLAKLHREGKGALSNEEHRFLDRMAERMRRRSD